jgi:hypothetical protein
MCYHELQTVGHCLLPLMRYFINIGLFVSNSLSNSFVHLQLALDFIFYSLVKELMTHKSRKVLAHFVCLPVTMCFTGEVGKLPLWQKS